MKALAFEQVVPKGDLAYRMVKNYARLEGKEYRPEQIFDIDKNGWPGDWEGRTILALTLLARSTGRTPAYLDAILEKLESEFNERGYLKDILPAGMANEQQLSGHNWLLRGLLELYLWRGDAKIRRWAQAIVENLYLPVKGLYAAYPLDPDCRSFDGAPAGFIAGKSVNGWYLSTDIGCAYMCLDALSQYYEIFRDERVAELLDEMIRNFEQIDFLGASMQTHASLSATRGILRYYQATGRKELLDFAVRFFKLYVEKGMTENYANDNWFGRPAWTEPCAIVDSFLLASGLFQETGVYAYAQAANRIYANGMGYAQRSNGGFGCDECIGSETAGVFLSTLENIYEAFWCCSMRGAEGLANAARLSVLTDADCVAFAAYYDGSYSLDGFAFDEKTSLPYSGSVRLDIRRCDGPRELLFYVPEHAEKIVLQKNGTEASGMLKDGFYHVTVSEPCRLALYFELVLERKAARHCITPGVTYWHGDLLLGLKTEKAVKLLEAPRRSDAPARYTVGFAAGQSAARAVLEPVNDSIERDREDMLARKIQVLF